jgi:hypothetical protein
MKPNNVLMALLVSCAASCGDGAPDVTPPTVTKSGPTGILPAGTTMTTLHVITDEVSTCKFSLRDTAYAAMLKTFEVTGGTTHNNVLTGLVNGRNYAYYIRCRDAADNYSTSSTLIRFEIAQRTIQ